MLAFVLRRLGLGVIVLWALSFASFCFLAGQDAVLQEHPVLPQYWTWLKGVFTGQSYGTLNTPIESRLNPGTGANLVDAIGHTVVLLVVAFVLVVLFGLGLALLTASLRGSPVDVVLRGLSYVAWAVPAFLLALIVQRLVDAVGGDRGVGPFPLAGWPGSCPFGSGLNAGSLQGCPAAGSGLGYVANVFRYITLPAATLAIGFIGLQSRYLRSALLETLEAPFVVTAYAKGLTQRRVVLRHALRASLPVFLSAVLADFGAIFGAALAVDWIYGLNGLGTVLVSDFPGPYSMARFTNGYSVQMVVMTAGVVVLLSSLLAELAVIWLDPRMRVVQ